jgi:RES domain-containing protein
MDVQSHPSFELLLRGAQRCLSLAAPWTGTLYRSTGLKYGNGRDLLSGQGSKRYGGRWNSPGSFPTVYGSLSPETAMAECLVHHRYFGIPLTRAMPRIFVAVEADLHRVLDLADPRALKALRLTPADIRSEDWRYANDHGREALTQGVGRAAAAARFEGLLTPSAWLPGAVNLAVFPANLRGSSRVRAEGIAKR